MIHNGIEYGMMQAYAEGFDILETAAMPSCRKPSASTYDVADMAEVWRRGSVVSSWLLDLAAIALAKDPKLDGFSGAVADSGEGRWTVEAAIEQAVPAEVLAAALFARFRSRRDHTFAEKLLSAMRFEFGGHVEAEVIHEQETGAESRRSSEKRPPGDTGVGLDEFTRVGERFQLVALEPHVGEIGV